MSKQFQCYRLKHWCESSMNNPPFNRTQVPLVIDGITIRKIFQACTKSSILLICSPTSYQLHLKNISQNIFFLSLATSIYIYLDVVEHDHVTHQAIVDYNNNKLNYDIIYKKLNIIKYHLYLNYQSLQFKLLRLPWI